MFTGIVERTGRIAATRAAVGGRRLSVEAGAMTDGCGMGASVCVSGVCLTIAAVANGRIEFDVVSETLNRSTLGAKRIGDRVNLERSLAVGDRFDGHFVQGHVDGTAVVERVQTSPEDDQVWLRPVGDLRPFLIPKGSVAVDGVSLTIARVERGLFSIALIPTTRERTTLSELKVGDRLNIESDIITRTVVHRLSELSSAGSLTLESLRAAGFA